MGHAELLKLSAGNGNVEVLTLSKSLTINFGLMGGRENSLCLLTLSSQTSKGAGVALDVDSGLLLEGSNAEIDENVIKVFTTEMGVAICGLDFKDAILNGEERHIESASTKIENEHILFTLTGLVKAVSDCGGSRLVDDTLHIETSNSAGVLGCLALGVIEVSRDGDDCRSYGLSEVSLCDFLHLDKDHR